MTAPADFSACLREEQELVLDAFSAADALALGLTLVDLAPQRASRPVAIHIETDTHPLFSHFMDGTGAGNWEWVVLKRNVVRRFGHSSWAVRLDYLARGLDFQKETGLDPQVYRAEGGAIPLVVRGRGRVATLVVSGLEGCDDHALGIEGLRLWMQRSVGR